MTEPAPEPSLDQQIIAASLALIAARRSGDPDAAATALTELARLRELRDAAL